VPSVGDLLDLHPAMPAAWRAAHRAGEFLLWERPDALQVESKSTPTDAVTQMDRGAEAMLVSDLLAEHPGDGVLGEEGGERRGSSGFRWVLDPLDGTINYLYRLPEWGVSVALEDQSASVLGVVVLPVLGLTYCAVRGSGAWCVRDGAAAAVHASECADVSRALVATGFAYSASRRAEQGQVAAALLPSVRDLRRSGAAVVDFCRVAAGQVDAFYERGLNRWDFAAGALIAREAGAVVRGSSGPEPDEVLGFASAPGIADELYRLVTAAP
jgi:fructose-1,6-bisphosphatase/inositol monophosphatase family enzyme